MSASLYNLFAETMFSLGDLCLSSGFMKSLREHRRYSSMGHRELHELQQRKLEKVLDFAVRNSPYYRKLAPDADSNPAEWLARFPVLTKPLLRENGERMLTRPKKDLILYSTSGSSGEQSQVYVDKKEQANFRAILVNWWEWTGYFLGKPFFQTGMTPKRGFIKKTKDLLTRTIYMNAFGLSEEHVLEYLKPMQGRDGYHLGGYASSLFVLAQIARKHDLDVRFDGAISWGDHMFSHYQNEIEKTFHTKVYENYGLNEGFMVGQKKDLDHFYVYSPNVFLEILDDDWQSVSDGEMGKVVLTKLDGFAMPLVRYYTGDLAVKLPSSEYPSERDLEFPLLKTVVGRDTDVVRTTGGKSLIVHFFTGIFEFYPEILQFRVLQNDLRSIEVEYIPSDDFPNDLLARLTDDIRKHVSEEELTLSFRAVEVIPATPSGKPQIIESNLQP